MKNRLVNDRYNVIVPDHIADWDAPSEWERQRFLSMEKHLKKGDVLYDIGAEQGWQSAIYAQFVGGENMVLVEPSPEFWPNIRQTWEANKLPRPHATYQGLVGNDAKYGSGVLGLGDLPGSPWPDNGVSEGEITKTMSYRNLHDSVAAQQRIDAFFAMGIKKPDAITIDTEGSEFEVLRGAEKTLRAHKPLVWLSIHPDLMAKYYEDEEAELCKFMVNLGYKEQNLGWDGHESHRFWQPK